MLRPATRAVLRPRFQPQFRISARTIIARNTVPSEAPNPPYLNIKLPDLSAPPPEPEVHIPFAPDFWESSRAKAEAARALLEEPQIPKVIVVAGDSARADSVSVPVQEHVAVVLEHHAEPPSDPKDSNLRSLFHDVVDDLVLPKDLSVLRSNKALSDHFIEEAFTPTSRSKFHYRTLDKDEVRGVWILLGLLAGSWIAGGLFKKDSKYTESSTDPII